jgi:hypothetical protein
MQTPEDTKPMEDTQMLVDDAKSVAPDATEQSKISESVSNITISDAFAEYQANHPIVTVCIMTPSYGNVCCVPFTNSLLKTFALFAQLKIAVYIEFCGNDSLVSRARNNLVGRAMFNPNVTHLMFIDSDLAWNPVDIVRMIIADKELIGGIYPLKKYNWDLAVSNDDPAAAAGDTLNEWFSKKNTTGFTRDMSAGKFLQCKLLKYNVNYASATVTITNNCAKVKHLPTGFMLIQRNTIERMAKGYPETKYTDDIGFLKTAEENKYAYALFDCGVVDDHYYSEDWMFCDRWSKIGGDTWIDVGVSLVHYGQEAFEGTLMSSLV